MDFIHWSDTQIFTFFFVLVRVTGLLFFLPVFGDRVIPANIKILFGLGFAWMVFPLLWAQGMRADMAVVNAPGRLIWATACDAGFGIMLGFVARWIFDAVQTAGHFAGTTIGFSIASVLDPHTESHTIALAEMHYMLAALLFLAMNGHHIYLSATLQSFKVVPIGTVNLLGQGDSAIQYIIRMSAEVLSLAVKLSAPVVVVILLINLTFGIMSRAVPQMNVMAVSFTANIIIGVMIALISMPGFVNMVGGAFDAYTPELLRFMRLFRGGG
jgi:flagellar biosynthetic protein FliR